MIIRERVLGSAQVRFYRIELPTPEQRPGLYESESRPGPGGFIRQRRQPADQRRQLCALPEQDIGDALDQARRPFPILSGQRMIDCLCGQTNVPTYATIYESSA